MNRAQFDHAVRAAGAILGTDEVLVIGSQAIHASTDHLFEEAQRSIEVDIAGVDDADGHMADLIDGSIGELSIFQETFGYYAQGVRASTAVLPRGWKSRLIRYSSAATAGVHALCLEPHDLWISKAVAGRDKDRSFCAAMLGQGLVASETLQLRIEDVPGLEADVRTRVLAWCTLDSSGQH